MRAFVLALVVLIARQTEAAEETLELAEHLKPPSPRPRDARLRGGIQLGAGIQQPLIHILALRRAVVLTSNLRPWGEEELGVTHYEVASLGTGRTIVAKSAADPERETVLFFLRHSMAILIVYSFAKMMMTRAGHVRAFGYRTSTWRKAGPENGCFGVSPGQTPWTCPRRLD